MVRGRSGVEKEGRGKVEGREKEGRRKGEGGEKERRRSEGYPIKLGGIRRTRMRGELDEYMGGTMTKAVVPVFEIHMYAYGTRSIWTSKYRYL